MEVEAGLEIVTLRSSIWRSDKPPLWSGRWFFADSLRRICGKHYPDLHLYTTGDADTLLEGGRLELEHLRPRPAM